MSSLGFRIRCQRWTGQRPNMGSFFQWDNNEVGCHWKIESLDITGSGTSWEWGSHGKWDRMRMEFITNNLLICKSLTSIVPIVAPPACTWGFSPALRYGGILTTLWGSNSDMVGT